MSKCDVINYLKSLKSNPLAKSANEDSTFSFMDKYPDDARYSIIRMKDEVYIFMMNLPLKPEPPCLKVTI